MSTIHILFISIILNIGFLLMLAGEFFSRNPDNYGAGFKDGVNEVKKRLKEDGVVSEKRSDGGYNFYIQTTRKEVM